MLYDFTGGAFNPTVGSIGPFTGRQTGSIEDSLIYWVAGPVAALGAAGFFKLQNQEKFGDQDYTTQFELHATLEKIAHKFVSHAHVQAQNFTM